MPFSTIDVPLNLGVRRDLTELASSTTPPALALCDNAVFTLEGEVTVRPGAMSADGQTMHALAPGLPSQVVASLGTEPDTRIGLGNFDGDPLVQAQGRMWRKRGQTWVDTGPFWSVRADYAEMVGEAALADPEVWPHAGQSIFAYPSTTPVANYSDNVSGFPVANGASVVGAKTDSKCAAGDAFFTTDGANLRMLRGYPSETRTLIATDCLVSGATNTPQRLWAVKATVGTGFYVVYQTNAGSVKLLRLSLTGTILNTITLTTGILASGSANLSLGLGANTTKLLLVATGTNDTILSKVITIASWTDAAVDLVHTEGVADAFRRVGAAITPTGFGYITASLDALGHCRILIRDVATASSILSQRIHGFGAHVVGKEQQRWRTLFPPQVLAGGRVLAGFSPVVPSSALGILAPQTPTTWFVYDITLDIRPLSIVACGQENQHLYSAGLGSADVSGDVLTFGVLRGTRFYIDEGPKVASARAQRVSLTPVPSCSTEVNGISVFSGQYPYYLDGNASFEGGYPIAPIANVALSGIPGTLANGDRSVSVCWAWNDAAGNTHRSAPSPRKTIANPTGEQLTVTATLPQWAASRAATSFLLEVYCSAPNPTENADLAIPPTGDPAITTLGAYSQSVIVGFEPYSAPPSNLPRGLTLYTGGNILDNERGFGNAGVATVGSRVWTAEGSIAYASKLITDGEAPSWSTEGSLQLNVPSGYGPIRALAGLDNMLIIICAEAVLVFTGQGPGNAGGPSDFDQPRRVYRAKGPVNACDVVEASTAVVWTSSTGEAHAIAPGGGCTNIGRATQSSLLRRPTFILGGNDANDCVAFQTQDADVLEVLDLGVGQWSTWRLPFITVDLGISGSNLAVLVDGAPYVVTMSRNGLALDDTSTTTVPITLDLRTRLIPIGHLGRVRSVKPIGKTFDTDVGMTVSVLSDQDIEAVPGNSQTFVLLGSTVDWPRNELPEFRTGVQRMESFAIGVTATPGSVRLTGLQVEVMDSTANPRNQRG